MIMRMGPRAVKAEMALAVVACGDQGLQWLERLVALLGQAS
jgi:hypothetical protein